MKREAFLRHLRSQGCEKLREGARHSWWHHPVLKKRSAVPRHFEINDHLAKKSAKTLASNQSNNVSGLIYTMKRNVFGTVSHDRAAGRPIDLEDARLLELPDET